MDIIKELLIDYLKYGKEREKLKKAKGIACGNLDGEVHIIYANGQYVNIVQLGENAEVD